MHLKASFYKLPAFSQVGVVTQAVIPATCEVEIRRIFIRGQPQQKVHVIPSEHGNCHLSSQLFYLEEIIVQAGLVK